MIIKNDKYALYKGDCLEVMDKLIEEGIVFDMVLCDTPYNTTKNKWDSMLPLDKVWNKLKKLTKNNSAVLLFGSQPYTTILNYSNIKDFRYEWVWVKNNSTGFYLANKKPLKKHELISVFYKKQPTYNPQGLIEYNKPNKRGSISSSWDKVSSNSHTQRLTNSYIQKFTNYPVSILEYPHDKDKLHPCQKPVALLEYLIKTYTNENELILDFTMGSGSTGIACLNTNRRFVGIELDDNYFNIAKERMENAL